MKLESAPDRRENRILVGRYRLDSKIAEGGFGLVYRATQLQLNRTVAVKIVSPDQEKFQEARTRFILEAATLAKLVHTNIVTIYDYGETEQGELFIVMEFLDGRPLDDLVQLEGPLPLDRVVRLAVQIGRALREAHAKGFVHRDLKPGNVMLVRGAEEGDPDHVKVLDFGLAKLTDAGDPSEHVGDATLIGTPRYMAPEQICGEETDFRADIYSFGCIMYFLLTGSPPFDGESRFDIIRSHLVREPRSIMQSGCRRDCPAELETIIMRCLEKSPDRRHCSVSALVEELKAIYGMLPNDGDVPRRSLSSQDLADDSVTIKTRPRAMVSEVGPSFPILSPSAPAVAVVLPTAEVRRPLVVKPWWAVAAGIALAGAILVFGISRQRTPAPMVVTVSQDQPEHEVVEAEAEQAKRVIVAAVEEAPPATAEVEIEPEVVVPKKRPAPRVRAKPVAKQVAKPKAKVQQLAATPPPPPPEAEDAPAVVADEAPPPEATEAAPEAKPAPINETPAPIVVVKREPAPSHPLTDAKCSKCHPPESVYQAIRDGRTTISQQLVRCIRLPHSGVSKDEAREILGVLTSYQKQVAR